MRSPPILSYFLGPWLSLAACAAPSAVTPAAVHPQRPSPHASVTASDPSADEPSDSARELGPHATFADLVRAARSVLGTPLASSEAACLLGYAPASGGFVLAADLLPALDRMPDPPTDLAAQLERYQGPFAVLSAFGLSGEHAAVTTLATFTTLDAAAYARPLWLLALDDEQAIVARQSPIEAASDGSARSAHARMPVSEALTQITAAFTAADGTLLVTASAETPLSRVRDALAALAPSTRTALAVVLPAGTTLPAPRPTPQPERCPTGLPEVAGDVPLGDLERAAIVPAAQALQRDLSSCTATLERPSARATLALRIDARGQVMDACLLDGQELDARTASCVLLLSRRLQTPPPSPQGVVDLHLPLQLSAQGLPHQQPLCTQSSPHAR